VPDVLAFARANLPPPPARVLEVGAGAGDLARALAAGGYDVVAIDPDAGADHVLPVALADLDQPDASFDAAVAVVSLHHIHPLEQSCERLAALVRTRGTLLVDEFDVERFDELAAAWWLDQRRARGAEPALSPHDLVAHHRADLHTLSRIAAALDHWFDFGTPLRGPYLYRWDLADALREEEEGMIAAGELPAVGARLIGVRS
jgi:SAM-dependent methyltransferase